MNQSSKEEQLKNALSRLNQIIQIPPRPHRVEIDASIRRFEFCIELFWKSLQEKLFKEYGISVQAPKTAFAQAYNNELITNEEIWIAMIDDRNLTVHTYNLEFADQMYHRIQKYAPFLTQQYAACFQKLI